MPSPNVSQRERRRDFFDQDSTRLEFGDRKYIDVFSSTCFNPRACMRRDVGGITHRETDHVSIHAPA